MRRKDDAVITHPAGHVDSYFLLREKVQNLKGKKDLFDVFSLPRGTVLF